MIENGLFFGFLHRTWGDAFKALRWTMTEKTRRFLQASATFCSSKMQIKSIPLEFINS